MNGMQPTEPASGRRSVRAVLLDDQSNLVLIMRTQPGSPPYWTTPGGGVLDGESVVDALRRELREELGATASIGDMLTPAPDNILSDPDQAIYLASLRIHRPETRCGPEWTDYARGGYTIVRVPVTDLPTINLKPGWLRDLVIANASELITAAANLP